MSITDLTPTLAPEQAPADDAAAPATATAIYAVLAAALLAWGSAIYAFGIPGLYLPALALVPVIWILLLVISRG